MRKRRRRRAAPLRRRNYVVEPQRRLYVFCEGARTEPYDRPAEASDVQARLHALYSAYDHEKSPGPDFSDLLATLAVAEQRASDQAQRRQEEGAPSGNPSTTVFQLLRAISVAHAEARRSM